MRKCYCFGCELIGDVKCTKLPFKTKITKLEDALLTFDDLMSHADFKNGVEARGRDEGDFIAQSIYYDKLSALIKEIRAKQDLEAIK